MKKLSFPPGIFTLLTITILTLLLAHAAEDHRTSRSSIRQAEQLARSAQDYYRAEQALQETIARVDGAIFSGEDPTNLPGVRRAENRLILEVPLPDGRILQGELTLTGPDSGTRYRLTGYRVLH